MFRSTGERCRRLKEPRLLLLLLLLAPVPFPDTQSLAAQEATEAVRGSLADEVSTPSLSRTAEDPPGPSRLLLVAGVSGRPGSAHGFAGGQLALGGERFGIMGHGTYGAGNQFSSLLLGMGPSARFAFSSSRTRIPLELRLFGGLGLYREALDEASPLSGAGQTRKAWGPQGGATLLTPVGPVRVGVGMVAWGGRYDAEPMDRGVPARGARFGLVLGR